MSQTKLRLIIRCIEGSQQQVEAPLADLQAQRRQAVKGLQRRHERRERADFDQALANLMARGEIFRFKGRYYSPVHQPKT